jgi:hypothetical protein
MSPNTPPLTEGDRVRATHRPGFPHGTVAKMLDGDFVLVRWDGDVLETAHAGELTKIEPNSTR